MRQEKKQKKEDQIVRSHEDVAILFSAYLMYLSPFQSYSGFKKIGTISTFETDSTMEMVFCCL